MHDISNFKISLEAFIKQLLFFYVVEIIEFISSRVKTIRDWLNFFKNIFLSIEYINHQNIIIIIEVALICYQTSLYVLMTQKNNINY